MPKKVNLMLLMGASLWTLVIVSLPSHTLLTSPLWCQGRHEKEATATHPQVLNKPQFEAQPAVTFSQDKLNFARSSGHAARVVGFSERHESDGHGSKKQRVAIITNTVLEKETRVVVYKPVEETRLVLYKEPDTRAMEVDFPIRVAWSAEEQVELEHTMTIFISQMKPSLGLYGFKTLNLLRYIDDTQYDLSPPNTSKPSPYLNDKERIEKRMRVFTHTMKYIGYSSRKKRGSDETEWWWDPFKTVFTIFDVCTKENL